MPKLTTRAFLLYWLPVIFWLAVIFAESVSIFAASDHTSLIVIPVLHWLFPSWNNAHLEEVHHVIRKLGHLTGYGLLSYFFFRAIRGTHHVHQGTVQVLKRAYRRSAVAPALSQYWRFGWMLFAMLCTFLVASADEMHQMTLPNRTGSWWDVLLDCVGGLIFQLIIFAVWRWRTRTGPGVSARAEA